jgi:signal transduction histidine kinase
LRRRVERVRARAEAQGIALDWQAPGGVEVPVAVDDLSLIVDHLLDNALKYTPEGGTIAVAVAPDRAADVVRLRVSDTGLGFDAEEADRLFERFYRTDDAEQWEEGGGLGLAIVKAVAERYGGTVTARSAGPQSGSTFVVRVPGR